MIVKWNPFQHMSMKSDVEKLTKSNQLSLDFQIFNLIHYELHAIFAS